MADRASISRRSVWTAHSTLMLFGFLALTALLPAVVDIYSFVLFRLLFIPAYLVSVLVYEGLGIEHISSVLETLVPGNQAYVWEGGQIVTYYLFAVVVTWFGRRLEPLGRGRNHRASGNRRE